MRARETHAGGAFLARERGAIEEAEILMSEFIKPLGSEYRGRLIERLDGSSLMAIATICNLTVEQLVERVA